MLISVFLGGPAGLVFGGVRVPRKFAFYGGSVTFFYILRCCFLTFYGC